MTNEISESVIPANATDTQLTAAAIQQRAQEMIEHASLEQVKTRLPDYVPVVESLIADLDFKNPLTLARVGSWALEGQATAGLELLSAVQQSPCQDAVTLVDQFGSELSKRIKPLEARQEAQNQKLIARQSWRTKTLAKFSAIFSSKDGVRTNQSKQLNDDMADLKATNALLNTVIVDTVADTQELIATLKANRGIPEMIQEQVENAKIVHADAAEKIYLSLVAVNEYRDDLEYNQIPELQAKAIDQAALPEDLDILTLAKDGLALLETRRTDLMAAFLNTALQHRMVAEMGKINANQATEMERLEAIALPQMLSTIGTMALQQRTGEQITGAIAANRILSDASKSNANGFTRVLELSKQADAAKLDAAERLLTTQRAAAGCPLGDFDLNHLRAIHRHLFSRLYDWAGEIRTVEIAKGETQFMFRQYIATGMANVHRRIVAADYFKGSNIYAFAFEAGRVIGDVNYVHPFR